MNFNFKSKSIGFWLTLGCSLSSLLTAIVYSACYVGTTEFNLVACLCLIAAFAIGALQFTKLEKLAQYLQFLLCVAACMFYIYGIYYYVSIVMVGIDLDSFSFAFIACTTLFIATMVEMVVNVFVKHEVKEAR